MTDAPDYANLTAGEALDLLQELIDIEDIETRTARMEVYLTAPGYLGRFTRKYQLILANIIYQENSAT